MAAPVLAGHAVTNQVMSAWELASATGQRAPIPPGILDLTSGFARQIADELMGDAHSRQPESDESGNHASLPVERFVAFLDGGAQSETT